MNTPIALWTVGGTVFDVTSFLRLVEDLLREPTERAAYVADPAGYLPARGFGDFEPADVELSLQLSADAFPPAVAELIDPAAGLDTIVSVDIDALPGLWNGIDSDELAFEELGDLDDPFLDADQVDDVASEASETGEVDDASSPGISDLPDAGLPDAATDQGFVENTVDDALTQPPDPDSSASLGADAAGFDSDLDADGLDEPDFSALDAFDGPGSDVDDGLFE